MKRKRIILFDDHFFFRESVRIMLEDRNDVELVSTFEDANNLVNDIISSQPDLVLMDIDMPGADGLEALKILKSHFEHLPVIMLTQHAEDEKIIRAICNGSSGYLLKTTSGEKIIESIHEVLCGGSCLNPVIARKVLNLFAESYSNSLNGDVFVLSPREKEVLAHLVKGKSYKMIASELDVCYDTIRMHIKSIYQKLRVSSQSGAVAVAVSHRLVRV